MTEATSDDRTVQHDTIVIDRRFAAAPARVFAAWATPAARARWAVPGTDWAIAGDEDDFHTSAATRPAGSALLAIRSFAPKRTISTSCPISAS